MSGQAIECKTDNETAGKFIVMVDRWWVIRRPMVFCMWPFHSYRCIALVRIYWVVR